MGDAFGGEKVTRYDDEFVHTIAEFMEGGVLGYVGFVTNFW